MAHWLLGQRRREAALCIVLLFQTYVRPSEGLSLLAKQVVQPVAGQPGAISQVSIVLHPEELGGGGRRRRGSSTQPWRWICLTSAGWPRCC